MLLPRNKTNRYNKIQYKNKTKRNFNKKPKKVNLVTAGLIYAEWCGHCQALKPHWYKMKKNMKNKKKSPNFIEIEDSDQLKQKKIDDINNKLGEQKLVINGFPTVFKIKGGQIEYYEGQRDADSLSKWYSEKYHKNNNQNLIPEMKSGCGCSDTKIL